MAISCTAFGDFLSRRSEHLDDEIIRSMHPLDTWVGHVSVGKFPAQEGVEHTFDRFENVFPDLTAPWENVVASGCIGQPCDPSSKKIGLGFTRDSYQLQRKAFETDLFCWDLILSADRAKQQFAHVVRTLRRCSSLITSDRFRHEAVRIAKQKWVTSNNTLTAVSAFWDSTGTILNISALPTSKLSARHLQRRVHPQVLLGALGEDINHGTQPKLEFVHDMEGIWDVVEGNPELSDHWRFNEFSDGEKYYKYGWMGSVGNYGLRADSMPLRFQDLGTTTTVNGVTYHQLQLVFPYKNVSATEGIKEALNDDFENAHFQANFIWHRLAMTSLVRDTTSINPEMPFAMRDFAGKWQFAMDNLTCGTDVNGNPIAVDNTRRNKGKFITDFSNATQAQYPEFAELMVSLREPACVVDIPTCSDDGGYTTQDYSSANAVCPTTPIVITLTPVTNTDTGTYEVPENSVLCNGLPIFAAALTGTSTLADLVAQMNSLLGAMGTWAVSGSNITLTGTACATVNVPWTV